MKDLFKLLKHGTKSSLWAAVVNTILGIVKMFAYLVTGNVAMFAEMMHSYGDAANQYFVYVGSALSKKEPTERFPGGFGRLINLVLLGAVIIVGILAYNTVVEGIHHIVSGAHSEGWFWLNVGILGGAAILETFVLYKAMKEVTHHLPEEDKKGLKIIPLSYKNLNNTNPATKLVFLEDNVAVGGAILALLAVIIATYTPFHSATGYASVIIGVALIWVVGLIFLDNAAGALGAADVKMQAKIGARLLQHPQIHDIQNLDVIKEGDSLHIEARVEVDSDMTIQEADELRDYIEAKITEKLSNVTDIILEFDKDDGTPAWKYTVDEPQ